MTNKVLGWLLIASIGLCVFSVSANDNAIQTLAGLSVLVFGIWSGVRLIGTPEFRRYPVRGPQFGHQPEIKDDETAE